MSAGNVVVLGGAGYVGTVLCQHLMNAGHDVHCIDNLVFQQGQASLGLASQSHFRFSRLDLRDRERVVPLLRGAQSVVVLAGLVGDPITRKFPTESESVNSMGMLRLLDACNGLGIGKLIFVSTCSNYGVVPSDQIANEDTDLTPLSLYATAKVSAERFLLDREVRRDFSPIVLRFATAFGLSSRMRFDLTVNEFTRDASLGRELTIYDADTWRPYCHVQDFAGAISRVLSVDDADIKYEVFNVGSDENNHTKRDLSQLVAAVIPNVRVKFSSGSGDPRNYRVDFSRIRRELDFEPKFSVLDGIREIHKAVEDGLFGAEVTTDGYFGNFWLSPEGT